MNALLMGADTWLSCYFWVDGTHMYIEDACDVDSWRWAAHAACADQDPDLFFDTNQNTEREQLITLCASCPVRTECLDHALLHNEHGWWGGMSSDERHQLRKAME